MLYLMCEFSRKFVGILYLSRDRKMVGLSHLTMFGSRNDITFALEVIDTIDVFRAAEQLYSIVASS